MTRNRLFNTVDFFAIRTPTLPFDCFEDWSKDIREFESTGSSQGIYRTKIKAAVKRPEVREALFLASPDLEEMLDLWLREDYSEKKMEHIDRALIRYLSRMASRSTPFGLFAGCSIGSWGVGNKLEVSGLNRAKRYTRLDMEYLHNLVEALEKIPLIRSVLSFRPNNGLVLTAGRYHYPEVRKHGEQGRLHHLVALEKTEYLDATLIRAEGGVGLEALAEPLTGPDVTLDEARMFVHRLIDEQILVSDLHPAITSRDALLDVANHLLDHPESAPIGHILAEVHCALQFIDQEGPGCPTARYLAVAEQLKALPVPFQMKHLFQVDLVNTAPAATLGENVRTELCDGIDLLARVMPVHRNENLEAFKEAFISRYEAQWIPFLECLDEETGIGFGNTQIIGTNDAPLLNDFHFGDDQVTKPILSTRALYCLRRVMELEGALEWELNDEDLKSLEHNHSEPIPKSFAAMVCFAATSTEAFLNDEFSFYMDHFQGPSGARMLGRFTSSDAVLETKVKAYLRQEESLDPEIVFAEIIHLPEGRMGNILSRPVLRDYEIPYLGASGTSLEHQIPLQDIDVGLVEGRIVLRSRRLGKEVVPRMTTAYNYRIGIKAYQFLGQLQDQDYIWGGWSWWNELGETVPFLPRVRRGRHIIHRAQWRLFANEYKSVVEATGSEQIQLFKELRQRRNLPRYVMLSDLDNELLIDLNHNLWVGTLIRLIAKRPSFVLVEFYPSPEELIATGPEGRYCHEVLVPFIQNSQGKGVAKPPLPLPTVPRNYRSFPPGSEWLYLKIYSATTFTDQILGQTLWPWIASHGAEFDRWFFIRYNDPKPHIRLRFHGEPRHLLGEVLPSLQKLTESYHWSGATWKVQVDTYEREIERYGGLIGIVLAEEIFCCDSTFAARIAATYSGDQSTDLLWRFGLLAMNRLLDDMGLNQNEKYGLIQGARSRFGNEFRSKDRLDIQLGIRFRRERETLTELLLNPWNLVELRQGLEYLDQRSNDWLECMERLRSAGRAGTLMVSIHDLALSFVHMSINRLLTSAQREQEFVLYDFLGRMLKSENARTRRPPSL